MIQVPKQFMNQDLGLNISETNLGNNISYCENFINISCQETTIFRKKCVYNHVFFQPATRFVYDLQNEQTKSRF